MKKSEPKAQKPLLMLTTSVEISVDVKGLLKKGCREFMLFKHHFKINCDIVGEGRYTSRQWSIKRKRNPKVAAGALFNTTKFVKEVNAVRNYTKQGLAASIQKTLVDMIASGQTTILTFMEVKMNQKREQQEKYGAIDMS